MTLGVGGNCQDVPESETSDYESSIASSELENFQLTKPIVGSSVKAGVSPTSGVHELLECPVCTNSMYPPIHQVSP